MAMQIIPSFQQVARSDLTENASKPQRAPKQDEHDPPKPFERFLNDGNEHRDASRRVGDTPDAGHKDTPQKVDRDAGENGTTQAHSNTETTTDETKANDSQSLSALLEDADFIADTPILQPPTDTIASDDETLLNPSTGEAELSGSGDLDAVITDDAIAASSEVLDDNVDDAGQYIAQLAAPFASTTAQGEAVYKAQGSDPSAAALNLNDRNASQTRAVEHSATTNENVTRGLATTPQHQFPATNLVDAQIPPGTTLDQKLLSEGHRSDVPGEQMKLQAAPVAVGSAPSSTLSDSSAASAKLQNAAQALLAAQDEAVALTQERQGERLLERFASSASSSTRDFIAPPTPIVTSGAAAANYAAVQVAQSNVRPETELERRSEDSIAGLRETTQTTQGALTGRSELARAPLADARLAQNIAQQLAAQARPLQNGAIEVSLHPEELGRVRMTVSMTEAGVHIAIFAERPETADVMRRHADILAQDFRNLGHSNLSLDFAGGSDAEQSTDKEDRGSSSRPMEGPEVALKDVPAAIMQLAADGRVDMRV